MSEKEQLGIAFSRIASVEKAIEVAHQDLVRVPTEVDSKISALKELLETKIHYESQLDKLRFEHIQERFQWVEEQRKEQKQDTKIMVEAAFEAQEKGFVKQNEYFTLSINKSEASTNKQIEGLHSKLTDLKDWQNRNEGQSSGKNVYSGYIVTAAGIAIAIAAVIVSIFALLKN